MKKPIYLDYNATTPMDPAVVEAIKPFFCENFGNPSSGSHAYGWEAEGAVTNARDKVAHLIGSKPNEIVWTSGATESNNLVVLGTLHAYRGQPIHLITTATEHKCVLEAFELAREAGAEISILPVNSLGEVDPHLVEKSLRPHTKLISVIMANNEIGTLNPIAQIGALTEKKGIAFHSDAAQALGKVNIDVNSLKLDFMSLSGHKNYGPKGVGALYVRKNSPKAKLFRVFGGGSQEGGLRPGTLNVPGIVGMGVCCEMSQRGMSAEVARLQGLRDLLIHTVLDFAPEAQLNGHSQNRLCNNVSFSFKDMHADLLTMGLNGLAVSSGSACASGSPHPSHVLKALGHSDELAKATVRVGIGRFTTDEDIQIAISKIKELVSKNRKLSIS